MRDPYRYRRVLWVKPFSSWFLFEICFLKELKFLHEPLAMAQNFFFFFPLCTELQVSGCLKKGRKASFLYATPDRRHPDKEGYGCLICYSCEVAEAAERWEQREREGEGRGRERVRLSPEADGKAPSLLLCPGFSVNYQMSHSSYAWGAVNNQ